MILCRILIKSGERCNVRTADAHIWQCFLRYDFEYEDDDEEQGVDVDIENKYYNAKQMKSDYPEDAIEEFLGVPQLESEKGDWWEERNLLSIQMV